MRVEWVSERDKKERKKLLWFSMTNEYPTPKCNPHRLKGVAVYVLFRIFATSVVKRHKNVKDIWELKWKITERYSISTKNFPTWCSFICTMKLLFRKTKGNNFPNNVILFLNPIFLPSRFSQFIWSHKKKTQRFLHIALNKIK